jgi:hypothetical protein
MHFREFLRTAVFACAASATLLAVLTLAGAHDDDETSIATIGVGWWALAAILGI